MMSEKVGLRRHHKERDKQRFNARETHGIWNGIRELLKIDPFIGENPPFFLGGGAHKGSETWGRTEGKNIQNGRKKN
jgi:hypothetical protein